MILVTLRVMALGLWRDRASLVLVFVLPPLVFIVFASVFSAGASGKLDIAAGIVDQTDSADSVRLADSLRRQLDGRLIRLRDVDALKDAIKSGRVDAGLVLHGDLVDTPTPATVLIHPGRRAAGEVLAAQINAVAGQDLPELMLRREVARLEPILALTPEQVRRADDMPLGSSPAPPFATEQVLPGGDPLLVYYAGAVSILFLMFTAMQGAMSLIDERRAGLRLRLGLSAGGVAPLLGGRMLWLIGLGAVQALVLFTVAAVIYGVPLLAHLAAWSAIAICAAAASAGIALAIAAACPTREQAQPVSTFTFLILAAIGGSMAPRFLMPEALQALGWFTPHTWVIEAYQTVLWRGLVNRTVVEAWAVLAGIAAAGFTTALWIEGRRRL
ncbi:MAG TPA: ABC transporter permease [Stellaceae bacterium]|jgi:ABC-2 type transport system permease protein|nr:ABC transporter permease [Stellaceae bacterium]